MAKYYSTIEAMNELNHIYYRHATESNPNPDFNLEPNYPFMAEMYLYWNELDNLNKYIEKQLVRYCTHDWKSYMELVDSIAYTMWLLGYAKYKGIKNDTVFGCIKDDDKFLATLEKWYNKMMYKKDFYSKYCTDEEIKMVWRVLN